MSQETSHDPRDRLVREKYFSLRPKPLERWLWQQSLPQAAERVFWLHWEEGMRNRDWCSQVPVKRVASLCCVDPSTVTRAYQVLKGLGLIRREDPGRDPENPFQQATAVTEVRIPRDLLTELSRTPNRAARSPPAPLTGDGQVLSAQKEPPGLKTGARAPESHSEPSGSVDQQHSAARRCPTRQEIEALWGKVSATERSRFFTASRNGMTAIEFDAETKLTPQERGELLTQLEQMARASRAPSAAPSSTKGSSTSQSYAKPRRLSPLELARTRKRVVETVPGNGATEILRQVVWAVEEGALRRFEMPLAVNIALKKIREGAWSRPNRMPPNWARLTALPETCSAA
jgi:hypothetical protein